MFPCNSLDRGNIPTPNLPSLYSSVMFNTCTSERTNLYLFSLLCSHFPIYHYKVFISNQIISEGMSFHLCISFFTSFTVYCESNNTISYHHCIIVISLITYSIQSVFNQSLLHITIFHIFNFAYHIYHSFKYIFTHCTVHESRIM